MTTSTLSKGLRELLLGLVVVFASMGAALSGGGQAHADSSEDGFVNQIRATEHDVGTYDQILSNGYTSCKILRTSDADTNDVARIAAPRIGLSYQFAIGQVVTAVRWLCPDQMYKVRLDQ